MEAHYGEYAIFGLRNGACHILPNDEITDIEDNLFVEPSTECMDTGYGSALALDVYMLGHGQIFKIW